MCIRDSYKTENIAGQMKTELLTALQPAFAKLSEMGIRYSALPGHTLELAEMCIRDRTKGGFARTKWCGKLECELKMKELAGVSSRCMPLKQLSLIHISDHVVGAKLCAAPTIHQTAKIDSFLTSGV